MSPPAEPVPLPCPMCGSRDLFVGGSRVECYGCGLLRLVWVIASEDSRVLTTRKAVEAWNRRAKDPPYSIELNGIEVQKGGGINGFVDAVRAALLAARVKVQPGTYLVRVFRAPRKKG